MTLCSARDCAMDATWKVDGTPYCLAHAKRKAADRRHPTLTRFEQIPDQEVQQ